MGLTLPTYSYKPDPDKNPKIYTNAYAWFVSGSQNLRSSPYSMNVSVEIYSSLADYQAGNAWVEQTTFSFADQADCGAIVYGHFPPDWTPPQAIDPVLSAHAGTPVTGPLMGLKAETAYLVRNHPVLGQAGAIWD